MSYGMGKFDAATDIESEADARLYIEGLTEEHPTATIFAAQMSFGDTPVNAEIVADLSIQHGEDHPSTVGEACGDLWLELVKTHGQEISGWVYAEQSMKLEFRFGSRQAVAEQYVAWVKAGTEKNGKPTQFK